MSKKIQPGPLPKQSVLDRQHALIKEYLEEMGRRVRGNQQSEYKSGYFQGPKIWDNEKHAELIHGLVIARLQQVADEAVLAARAGILTGQDLDELSLNAQRVISAQEQFEHNDLRLRQEFHGTEDGQSYW